MQETTPFRTIPLPTVWRGRFADCQSIQRQPGLANGILRSRIQDRSWKKGHRYGTILIDLERSRVLDLLPDRNSSTLQAWLKEGPEIEVISRDRSGT